MKKYDYLEGILKKGEKLKVLLLSHNSYWNELQNMSEFYQNLELTLNGGSTLYLDMDKYQLEKDYDLILFYSNEEYSEDELLKLKNIAFEKSNDNDSRVSIGYSYILPENERLSDEECEQIKLVSFKNCIENNEITYGAEYFNTLDLMTMTLIFHNGLENKKDNRLNDNSIECNNKEICPEKIMNEIDRCILIKRKNIFRK